jgi:uncharacterized integral membrane protein (TIGR00697 family)
MHQFSESSLKKLLIALAVYITSLVAANTLGIKIMPFLFGSHLSVGVFMFPVVFLGTDVIGEVYGKKVAKWFVFAGTLSTILFIIYNLISVASPWAPEGLWVQSSYNQVFAVSLRFAIASVIAYVVGEYQDVLAFFFTKKRMGEGKLPNAFWLRSFLSNVWSQAFDTILFMTIALYGVYPNETLISIMLTWWVFKILMGLVYTPFAYAFIRILRGKEHAD